MPKERGLDSTIKVQSSDLQHLVTGTWRPGVLLPFCRRYQPNFDPIPAFKRHPETRDILPDRISVLNALKVLRQPYHKIWELGIDLLQGGTYPWPPKERHKLPYMSIRVWTPAFRLKFIRILAPNVFVMVQAPDIEMNGCSGFDKHRGCTFRSATCGEDGVFSGSAYAVGGETLDAERLLKNVLE